MISALFLFVFVSFASANMERVNTVLYKEKATILPWMTPQTAVPETLYSIIFVEDSEVLNPISNAMAARGHTVSRAHFGQGQGITLQAPVGSSGRFGAHFDAAVAAYETLKTHQADYLVFTSKTGLAYMCQEAKEAGIAFQKTHIVVVAFRPETIVGRISYQEMISRFIAMRSIELADTAIVLSGEKFDDVKFRSSVNLWQVSDMSRIVAVIESITAHPRPVAIETPLLSVIVTSFNRPELLKQAVASLKAQTYKQLEIIVVDDGSTAQGMEAALNAIAAEGVKVVRQTNKYLGAARNAGAKVAKGSLLAFLDDDNVALPTMMATLVQALKHAGAEVAVNAHYGWHGKVTDAIPTQFTGLKTWCPVGPAVAAGMDGNVFGNANFLIKKESFFALSGFTEERAGWEDHEFHARASIAGLEYVVVPEPLMLYRFHDMENQMIFKTDNKKNVERVKRAYNELLSQANVQHDFSERIATECSINAVTFNDANTANPQCTTAQVSFTIVDTQGGIYTTAQTASPRITMFPPGAIVGFELPASTVQCQPGTSSSERVPWTCRLTASLTSDPIVARFNVSGNYRIGVAFDVTIPETRVINCNPFPYAAMTSCSLPEGVCFHESTRITYDNKVLSMADFENHESCVIPHKVVSDGVRIATTCGAEPLRLTRTHLVFTTRGVVKAASLQKDDVVFSDLNQEGTCTVLSVTEETNEKYFGLNCLKSVVLANGIKASTFGDLHTLPAVWMSWVGSVAGVDRASRWGGAMESLARKIGVL